MTPVGGEVVGPGVSGPQSGGSPGGAAGGVLSGTYPNPGLANSVALPGSPTTTTQAPGDNSTKVATDQFVATAIANAIAGVNPAVAVQAATTQASDTSGLTYNNGVAGVGATLTGVVNTPLTVDGFTFSALGQRLLVKNDTQTPAGAFNGVYFVTQLQTALLPVVLTRALDYDTPSDINNTGAIPVVNGTANALTSWLLTSAVNTVGTDPLTYAKFSTNPAAAFVPSYNKYTSSQSVTPPAGTYVIRAVGGGGGGGNGAVATSPVGAGGGGGAGLAMDQTVVLNGSTALIMQIGGGGSAAGAGTNTTVTGTGISVAGKGGGAGQNGSAGANGNAGVAGGDGTGSTGSSVAIGQLPGQGGTGAPNAQSTSGPPTNVGTAGGAGGIAENGSAGQAGGAAGAIGGGNALNGGGTAGSGTSGGAGGGAAANSGCGGGGGGAAFTGGTGGAGGAGGSGWVEIWRIA